jgi:hypothetical protein
VVRYLMESWYPGPRCDLSAGNFKALRLAVKRGLWLFTVEYLVGRVLKEYHGQAQGVINALLDSNTCYFVDYLVRVRAELEAEDRARPCGGE